MKTIPLDEFRRQSAARDDDAGPRPFAPIDNEAPPAPPPKLLWHGDEEPLPPPYLVDDVLPQTQVAIVAGQSGSGKTFTGIDLAVAVMTGTPFVGRDVNRKGAVLWLAAEGSGEVPARLKAALVQRLGDEAPRTVPFARQAFEVPNLTGPDALKQLTALVDVQKAALGERFPGTELVLIVIDTLNSAAEFADENSSAETQKVMNLLRRLSDYAGALVLVIDHYGKMAETGVRGSSAKTGAADAILAVLADKNTEGEVSNRRLAVVKLRSAPTGRVIPFKLKSVQIDRMGTTHCGIEWSEEAVPGTQKVNKPVWSGNARILKAAIERATIEHGQTVRPWGADEREQRAVKHDRVRTEFYASYMAESQEAKQKAFRRLCDQATSKGLIASREIAGTDWLWLVKTDTDDPDIQPDRPDSAS